MSTLLATKKSRPHHSSPAVYGWGYNNLGGLGTGTTARTLHPAPLDLPEGIVDLQGGTDFTVALTESGAVWTWGGNRRGQLGTATGASTRNPQRVHLPAVSAISVGENHVLAVTHSGHLYGWGDNRYGQLHQSTQTEHDQPVDIAKVGRGAVVATGNACSMLIDAQGRLQTWGKVIPGTIAVSPVKLGQPRSITLPGSARAAQVDAGQRHLVVLTEDGQLLAYGLDAGGKPTPERPELTRTWGRIAAVSVGDNHTVALTATGQVLTWGMNYHGQLGLRDPRLRRHPAAVRMPSHSGRVAQVLAAGDSTYARTDTNRIYAWGHGGFGQSGIGHTTDQSRPTHVELPEHVRVESLHAGRYHAHVLLRPTH